MRDDKTSCLLGDGLAVLARNLGPTALFYTVIQYSFMGGSQVMVM
jgi:hypothetical protein